MSAAVQKLPTPEGAAEPGAKPTFVQVPEGLLQARHPGPAGRRIPPVDPAAYLVVASHSSQSGACIWAGRDRLMSMLGRTVKEGNGRTVTRSTDRLHEAGYLQKKRAHYKGKTRALYFVQAPRKGGFVTVVRDEVLPLMAEGVLKDAQVVELLRWYAACGEQGWTRDSLRKHAALYGSSVTSAKRARSKLVDLGLLETATDPGRRTVTARPGKLPEKPGADVSLQSEPNRGQE